MAFTRISDDMDIIQALANQPTESASELKTKFDEAGNTLKTRINALMAELEATTGADSVGIDALNVSASNVADAIAEVQANLASYVLGEITNNTITNAKLASDIKVGSLASLTTTETESLVGAVNEVNANCDTNASDIAKLQTRSEKNLINILYNSLQLTANTANIDAWADIFSDNTLLDLDKSWGFTVTGGKLDVALNTPLDYIIGGMTISGTTYNMGYDTTIEEIAVKIVPTNNCKLTEFGWELSKVGTPTDNLKCTIRTALDGTDLYTADAEVAGNTLATTTEKIAFTFTDAFLKAGTAYYVVLDRTGALSTSNFYECYVGDVYGNTCYRYGQGVWASNASHQDWRFSLTYSTDTEVVWKGVVTTETLAELALVTDEAVGTGSITWYCSDDGVVWTELTIGQMNAVAFTGTDLYIKCVLTGDSEVYAVAFGG